MSELEINTSIAEGKWEHNTLINTVRNHIQDDVTKSIQHLPQILASFFIKLSNCSISPGSIEKLPLGIEQLPFFQKLFVEILQKLAEEENLVGLIYLLENPELGGKERLAPLAQELIKSEDVLQKSFRYELSNTQQGKFADKSIMRAYLKQE